MADDGARVRTQRNFLRDFDTMLKTLMLDYVDCARYEASGYADFIGKLYTLNGAMFQSPVFCDHTLTQMMLHYLAWFQDPAVRLEVGPGAAWHVRRDCRVQRLGDELWVVAARPGAPMCAGERIVGVNGMGLDAVRPEVERMLHTTVEPVDPEREDWSYVLAFAKKLAVVGTDGAERTERVVPGDSAVAARMRAYYAREAPVRVDGVPEAACDAGAWPADEGPACTLAVDGGVAVVRIARPGDGAWTAELGRALDGVADLRSRGAVDALVMDVRGAAGGVQEDVYPLVAWLLDAGDTVRPADVFGRPGVVMNCSRHNVDAKLAELAAVRARLAAAGDEGGLAELDALAEELAAKRGRGLVVDGTDYYADVAFAAAAGCCGGRTVVLCDRYTADAGEWLVRAARSLGRTVVGRATAGSIDNTCLRTVRLDEDFSLVVPTAKYLGAQGAGATLGRGIAPDVHLAWDPQQLARDIELEHACAIACGAGR